MKKKHSYPSLRWPANWPRTPRLQYLKSKRERSMNEACAALATELVHLESSNSTLSSNLPTDENGRPYHDDPWPEDAGAAVFFEFRGMPIALACDKWDRVADNVWAIARHLASIRRAARLGVGTIEQAFRSYAVAQPAVLVATSRFN